MANFLPVMARSGLDDTGNHGGAQGGGNGHRHIGKQPIFAAINAKKSSPLGFNQPFFVHDLAEHGVINRTTELVDKLA